MIRRHWHGLFGLAVLLLGLSLAHQGWSLQQIVRETERLETIRNSSSNGTDVDSRVIDGSPRLQFAAANRLIRLDRVHAAEQALSTLIREQADTPLGHDARFNLANLYLRQAITAADAGESSTTFVELAKRGYRELLHREPNYWPARYNLERALRLAPETADNIDSESDPVKRVNVIVPDFESRDLP